ncbi:NEDD4-binding protein 2 isoform X2 [Agrilus planipennis]|nr:NEDD4-binding protein 2 isoform X2 [Agrilus planipennis]XP_025834922.1 NEDD4-binding protein 2 isoform X2 [Agrilus planipennis]XP_025834923.1 NEDD4-binding protein 2 isoform X2 [Agrilus planipennis]XP_025834924.1 NEDD4-binding protein 2 isoform X2 [Agrilus planipennis]
MATNLKEVQRKQLVNHLKELFGSLLDLEIIESVALNCDYDEVSATNMLIELSSNVDGFVSPKNKNKSKNTPRFSKLVPSPVNYSVTYANASSSVAVPHSRKDKELERIIFTIQRGYKVLVLMRGLPGSGKSTLARYIVERSVNPPYFQNYEQFIKSTDDYFTKNGIYNHNPSQLPEAHSWNQNRTYQAMISGISPIIIDNTNVQMWEMKSYAIMAVQNGYYIEIVEPKTQWAFNEKELLRRNLHGVPRKVINDMLTRYEKNITTKKLMAMYNLRYFVPMPQMRIYPPIVPLNNFEQTNQPEAGNTTASQQKNIFASRSGNSLEMVDLTVSSNANALVDLTKDAEEGQTVNESNESTSQNNENVIDLMNFDNEASSTSVSSESPKNSSFINEIFDVSNEKSVEMLDPLIKFNVPENNKIVNDDILAEPSTSKNQEKSHALLESVALSTENVCSHSDTVIPLANSSSEPDMKKLKTSSQMEGEVDVEHLQTKLRKEEFKKPINIYPKLDLSSWGLSETTRYSWEPLESPPIILNNKETRNVEVETANSSTNTYDDDFKLLLPNSKVSDPGIIFLTCVNRDIIANNFVFLENPKPPLKVMLDKSSMTDDHFISVSSENEIETVTKHMQQLVNLFPDISLDLLKDVYEKCNKDVEWTIDLLLEGNLEVLQIENKVDEQPSSSLIGETEINNTIEEISSSTKKITLEQNQPNPVESKNEDPSLSNKILSTGKDLVKFLEKQFIFGNQHYSDHILKVKSRMNGSFEELNVSKEPIITKESKEEAMETINLPSTSIPVSQNSKIQPSTSSAVEICHSNCGDIFALDTEKDFDDLENSQTYANSEEMMELNLGDVLVSQLESTFGNFELYPKGFQPVVQMPVSLARQLFAFYLESVYSQMEAQNQVLEQLVKEDEEFAKTLQENEEREMKAQEILRKNQAPNLKDIMAREKERNKYIKEIEQWKKLTPDDLAAKLTRKKLFDSFPTIDQDLLVEILHAHNNSYQQTVEVLLNSTKVEDISDPYGTILQPPISSTILEEMKEAQQENTENDEKENKSANELREEARKHLAKRHELYLKAQKHFQKGEGLIASYYSSLAEERGLLYEKANTLAAHMLLNDNSQKKDFHTLDLHYLYVKEAISALDIFMDRNIMLVSGNNNKNQELFIITGRGKGSKDGKSKLKPAVISRLRKRKLNYCIMNPGLLKVYVNKNSLMSNDVGKREI